VVGEHTAIAAQAGLSGSTILGACVRIGGQVGFAGHTTVGDYGIVTAQSGVDKDIPEKCIVSALRPARTGRNSASRPPCGSCHPS